MTFGSQQRKNSRSAQIDKVKALIERQIARQIVRQQDRQIARQIDSKKKNINNLERQIEGQI